MNDITFFIVRCITKPSNSFYWKICYDRIRLLYPNNMIYIIDDNSKLDTYEIPITTREKKKIYGIDIDRLLAYGKKYPDLSIFKGDPIKLYKHWNNLGKIEERILPYINDDVYGKYRGEKTIWEELPNCIYIKSEFKGRGEFLGYYYFYKLRPTKQCVVLHDSVFINKPIPFYLNRQCTFLWHFNKSVCLNKGNRKDVIKKEEIYSYIKLLTDNNNTYNDIVNYVNKQQWIGCFGIMSIIHIDFLESLQSKYQVFDVVLQHITSRHKRQCLERLFGIIVCYELKKVKSVYGDIKKYCKWGTPYKPDMISIETLREKLPITKVWTGR